MYKYPSLLNSLTSVWVYRMPASGAVVSGREEEAVYLKLYCGKLFQAVTSMKFSFVLERQKIGDCLNIDKFPVWHLCRNSMHHQNGYTIGTGHRPRWSSGFEVLTVALIHIDSDDTNPRLPKAILLRIFSEFITRKE